MLKFQSASLFAKPSLAVLTMAFATLASAGEFFETNGVAIEGYDPVAYFTDQQARPGKVDFKAEYKGSVFYFLSAANRARFQATPEAFAPQFGGFCAYGMAGGYKAKIDPQAFTVINDKLYLNYNAKVQTEWNKDRAGYLVKAEAQWPSVSKQSKVAQ